MAWKETCRSQWASFLPRIDANYDNMGQSKDYDNARIGLPRTYWSAGLSFSWEFFSGGNTIFQTLSEKGKGPGPAQRNMRTPWPMQKRVIRSLLDIQAAKDLCRFHQGR